MPLAFSETSDEENVSTNTTSRDSGNCAFNEAQLVKKKIIGKRNENRLRIDEFG